MNRTGVRSRFRLVTAGAAAIIALTACGSTGSTGGSSLKPPPTANMAPLTSIGAGEGALNLVDWGGYVDPLWKAPFEKQTGCKINAKDAGSSDEMVSLMANGGGGQWDMVSASGDADLRLIYGGDVRPMNTALIPDWANFQPQFKSPAFNTINGIHYGISLQWGPNTLLYSTKKFPNAPTSWSVIYDPALSGLITIPDNAIQIADAALYLSKKQPGLNIKDPYELTKAQFDAAVNLLKQQRPLVKKYWADVPTVETLFKSGDAVAAAAWPVMTSDLKKAGAATADTIPSEGATGWADTWMLATKAPHPNCAYMWTAWVSTPFVQAQQALTWGETPVNTKACAEMELQQPGSCSQYHADAPGSYFDNLKFWKTPVAACGDGSNNCIPYSLWQTAWTSIKG
ncbi:MAG: ABC transporter substrate-binding protein [Candidatus Dormibacteraeota bacterium]|nr:ABC transporter substrate-binding protein [Candidatus Dormibacteraeota bacterium]